MFSHLRKGLRSLFLDIRLSNCLVSFFASAFLAFGLYQVHAVSQVTEGGVLGMMLLLEHWTGLSPSVSGLVMDAACYALGWRLLGRSFLVYSGISSLGFSAAYRVLECFPRLWPGLSNMPLLASVLGAIFVGLGAGLCVRAGGATGGDDALAMSLSRLTRQPIERIYLASDLIVLALSASYIPLKRLGYSLLTVLLSGQLIGLVQRAPLPFLPTAEGSRTKEAFVEERTEEAVRAEK